MAAQYAAEARKAKATYTNVCARVRMSWIAMTHHLGGPEAFVDAACLRSCRQPELQHMQSL